MAADAMMLANLGPAQAREERLGLVGIRAFVMEGDAVVDPPSVIEGVQGISGRRFVGIDGGAMLDHLPDVGHRLIL